MQKVEKERASLTEEEIKVSTESVDTVGPMRSQYKNERMCFLQIATAFGWHSCMIQFIFLLRTEVTKDNCEMGFCQVGEAISRTG